MGVLTRDEILKAVERGDIEIDPFNPALVGPGSVDLHLDNQFRVFKKLHHIYNVTDEADFTQITELVEVTDSFVLLPGESALGITKERIKLAPFLCGRLEGRSRFARLGLMVHVTAGFMQPGINNRQVPWACAPAPGCVNSSSNAPKAKPSTRDASPPNPWPAHSAASASCPWKGD